MNFDFVSDKSQKDPLVEFGRNLLEEAKNNKLSPVIGRDDEIRRIIRILSRKTKNNPILIGEPGVGKTAIVEGLAQKISKGEIPENLKNKELYEIDLPAMVAGTSFQGQFEQRIKSLMKKIKNSNGNIIIFIDEIHTLIGLGKNNGGMDAAQIIKPMLARGEMHLIGATTLNEHSKYIESDPALERRMQKIIVIESSIDDSITILRGLKDIFESFHGVTIKDDALITAVKLSARYISDRFLPDKAIDLIDEAASAIQTEINSMPEPLEKIKQLIAKLKMEKAALSKEDKETVKNRLNKINIKLNQAEKKHFELITQWTDDKKYISKINKLKEKLSNTKNEMDKLKLEGNFEKASKIMYSQIPELEKKLQKAQTAVDKQDKNLIKETVTSSEVANVVSKWTGIPLNNLLESQKTKLLQLEGLLKKNIKGQDHAIKLISETIIRSRAKINDPDRPIGSFIFMGPTGVGKTEVSKILAKNLFDTEKAIVRIDMSEYMEKHSISKLIGSPPGYIGFGEGGQLTESIRQKPYSIVLFDEIEKAHPDILNILLQILDDGQATDSKGNLVNFKNTIIIMTTNIGSEKLLNKKSIKPKEVLLQYLKPEFINRIDEIIPFEPLSKKHIEKIALLELNKLTKRLIEQKIYINFDNLTNKAIVKNSYDPFFGARPIKNYIKRHIESIIAKKIISSEIKKNKKYELTYSMNNFEINKI